MGLVNLRENTAAAAVYEYVYREITHRRLFPGQLLTENYLCACLNVGRSPVRVALQQLAKDGFVELRANRSTIVTCFTQKQLQQLYSLREVFLEYALRQTIQLYEKEDIAALTAFLSDMERAFESRAFDDYIQAVAGFYSAIIEKADNPYLSESAAMVINRINVYICLYDNFHSVKRLKTLSMQSRIVQGIQDGKLGVVLRAHQKLSNQVVAAYDQVVRRNLPGDMATKNRLLDSSAGASDVPFVI